MPAPADPADFAARRRRAAGSRLLRSSAISLAALVVLAIGFAIYWHTQPTVVLGPTTLPTTFPAVPPNDPTEMQIGPGYRPWVDNYDRGKLSSQFTAQKFTPIGDGNFAVDRPVWVFYQSDGQFLLLTGDSAKVHVDSAAQSGGAIGEKPGTGGGGGAGSMDGATISTSFMQMPSSGTLQHVHASLFPFKTADRPTLVLITNNLAFDHDTLRLYTQGFTDSDGQFIAADRVPVTVRGDDYDFDGQGLSMHWDDRDHRLQLLEIEHGQRLVIKHPSKLNTPLGPASAGGAAASIPASDVPVPAALADADARGATMAVAKSLPPASENSAPVIYQAVFNQLVRVWQGEQLLATADTMTVDFLGGGGKKPTSAAAPSGQSPGAPPSNEPLITEPVAPPAATRAAGGSGPASQPATTAPATAAAAQPVTVRWVGKLRLTPVDGPPILPLLAGQSAVRLVGSPVVLTPKGSIVHAAAAVYRTGDSAGRLENSPAVPRIDVRQDRGLAFEADSASYDPATALATIVGPSNLSLPLQGQPHSVMTARWNQVGKIHVLARGGSPQSVDHIDLLGEVKVAHPQFTLDSTRLALDLAPVARPASRAAGSATPQDQVSLKRVTAVGDVVCRLTNAAGPPRGIDSDRLVIDTAPGPDGKPAPHTVVADGSVRAFDPVAGDELRAGHMAAVLAPVAAASGAPSGFPAAAPPASAPATGPAESVAIESLLASDAVHATLKGGATADADRLHLTTPGGRQHVELYGSAHKLASVSDRVRGTLSGPIIRIDPDRSAVAVDGPGLLHTDRRASATQPSQPVDVTWTHDLAVDESANTVDVHGHIVATMVDANADHNQIVGDTAHADLMDAPPATQPAPDAAPLPPGPTTHPASNPQKQIRDLAIRGHVVASSLLLSPDGRSVYRRGVMDADEMDYDALSGQGLVPGPGRMLVEDHRPRQQQPAPAGGQGSGAAATPADSGNTRGRMAIQWARSLLYDQEKKQITFSGNVHTVFQQDQKNAEKMQLVCDQLIADLAQVGPTTAPAGAAPGGASAAGRMQLKQVTAAGAARFTAKDLDMTAGTIQYDPATAQLTARGTPSEPGHFLDAQGQSAGNFDEVIYDTAAEKIISERGLSGSVNR